MWKIILQHSTVIYIYIYIIFFYFINISIYKQYVYIVKAMLSKECKFINLKHNNFFFFKSFYETLYINMITLLHYCKCLQKKWCRLQHSAHLYLLKNSDSSDLYSSRTRSTVEVRCITWSKLAMWSPSRSNLYPCFCRIILKIKKLPALMGFVRIFSSANNPSTSLNRKIWGSS